MTSSVRTELDTLTSSGAGADRPEALWTDVPAETTPRTRALAEQLTAGAGRTDRVAAARAVESWLRENVRYRLDAPVPADGQDAVDFLLFESLEGFCQHFAAAEVVLLRSAGIPARMATGYSITTEPVDGWAVGRGSDAHAWVEVWVPGHGWVTSDPTRGAQLSGSGDSWWGRASATLTSWFASDSSRRVLALAVVLGAGVALGAVSWRRRRSRARTGVGSGRSAAQAEPLAAFARLCSAVGVAGQPLRPGDGLDEVRRRLASHEPPHETPPYTDAQHEDLLAALDVVERCLYGGVAVPTDVRLAASATLDHHTARLHAEARLADART